MLSLGQTSNIVNSYELNLPVKKHARILSIMFNQAELLFILYYSSSIVLMLMMLVKVF